jgi:hypothetical protein
VGDGTCAVAVFALLRVAARSTVGEGTKEVGVGAGVSVGKGVAEGTGVRVGVAVGVGV